MSGCANADFHDDWYLAVSTNCAVSKWFDVSVGGAGILLAARLAWSVVSKISDRLANQKNRKKSKKEKRFNAQMKIQLSVLATCVFLVVTFSLVLASAIDGTDRMWFRLFEFLSTALYYETIRRVGVISIVLSNPMPGMIPVWYKNYPVLNAAFFAAVTCAYTAYLLAIVTNVDAAAPVDQNVSNWTFAASCAVEVVFVSFVVVNIGTFTTVLTDSAAITAESTRVSRVSSAGSKLSDSTYDKTMANVRHFNYVRIGIVCASAFRLAAFVAAGFSYEFSEVKFGYAMWACAIAALLVNLWSISLNVSRNKRRPDPAPDF